MKTHTVGFIFDPTLSRVVLIRKNRPAWQAGKLNGIGGKIEPGEESIDCMVRETREETGLTTKPNQWLFLGTIHRDEYGSVVDFYATVHTSTPEELSSHTDEQVEWCEVARLPDRVLSNIPWLVAFARDALQSGAKHTFVVEYKK